MWSQLGGTLPAPLFLFLAGISFALGTDKLRQRGVGANDIARTTIHRGTEIFGLGLLFRVQEFLLGQPLAPWTDLLRVGVLNMIGVSMILMGLVCRAAVGLSEKPAEGSNTARGRTRFATVAAAVIVALVIALATPPLWTTWRPRWLPWPLESYVNGVHTFPEPQPWLFPFFPWAGFSFIGLAVGFVLLSDWSRKREPSAMALLGAVGLAVGLLA